MGRDLREEVLWIRALALDETTILRFSIYIYIGRISKVKVDPVKVKGGQGDLEIKLDQGVG